MNARKNQGRIETSMKFEDWIRQHITTERLKQVESVLIQESLYPPLELFKFSGQGLLPEIVYRIHHESFKAIEFSEWIATTSIEELVFLFFGETIEDSPFKATLIKPMFLKHLRSRQSDLYAYFVVVEKVSKRLEKYGLLGCNTKKDSMKILGAAVFWYMTLLGCMEVARKVLADEKWERGLPLTWDEATTEYVAFSFSTKDELRENQWWLPSKAAVDWAKDFKQV